MKWLSAMLAVTAVVMWDVVRNDGRWISAVLHLVT